MLIDKAVEYVAECKRIEVQCCEEQPRQWNHSEEPERVRVPNRRKYYGTTASTYSVTTTGACVIGGSLGRVPHRGVYRVQSARTCARSAGSRARCTGSTVRGWSGPCLCVGVRGERSQACCPRGIDAIATQRMRVKGRRIGCGSDPGCPFSALTRTTVPTRTARPVQKRHENPCRLPADRPCGAPADPQREHHRCAIPHQGQVRAPFRPFQEGEGRARPSPGGRSRPRRALARGDP